MSLGFVGPAALTVAYWRGREIYTKVKDRRAATWAKWARVVAEAVVVDTCIAACGAVLAVAHASIKFACCVLSFSLLVAVSTTLLHSAGVTVPSIRKMLDAYRDKSMTSAEFWSAEYVKSQG